MMGYASRANTTPRIARPPCPILHVRGRMLATQTFRRCLKPIGHRGRHDWGAWQKATREEVEKMIKESKDAVRVETST